MTIITVDPNTVTARQLMRLQPVMADIDYELVFSRYVPPGKIIAYSEDLVYFGPAE